MYAQLAAGIGYMEIDGPFGKAQNGAHFPAGFAYGSPVQAGKFSVCQWFHMEFPGAWNFGLCRQLFPITLICNKCIQYFLLEKRRSRRDVAHVAPGRVAGQCRSGKILVLHSADLLDLLAGAS